MLAPASMALAHPAQLRICHERIAAAPTVLHRLGGPDEGLDADIETKWCSLRDPLLWCYTCGKYLCTWHASARHGVHRVEPD